MKKNVIWWVGVKNELYSENMEAGNGWIFPKKLGNIGVKKIMLSL